MADLIKYPSVALIVDMIACRSSIQKKKIGIFISTKTDDELCEMEELLAKYIAYLKSESISLEYAIEAYLGMITNMIRCQIYFQKTGRYPVNDSQKTLQEVYSDESKMKPYMIGLAISQFLWESHFRMFKAFRRVLNDNKNRIKNYLEIGPGHGLYFQEAIETLAPDTKYVAIDISKTSIGITKEIISYLVKRPLDVEYIVRDMLEISNDNKFDFITMGEVLEHVEKPALLLNKMSDLLSEDGSGFISTCMNCPAIDHVFQFHSIEEIRKIIVGSGLRIASDYILPVENLPLEDIIRQKITINYCAVVKK